MSSAPVHYDLVTLGSGEVGKMLAWKYSGMFGKTCASIESKWIGGSCPNVACLPSKNVLYTAANANTIKSAGRFGVGGYVHAAEDMKVDMAAVKQRKVEMVKGLTEMHLNVFDKFGVDLIRGFGRFTGPKTIQIDDGRVVTADTILIGTGSRSLIDDRVPGLIAAEPMTHVEILDLDVLPDHLIIVGGGYIGIEFAQAYKRFGARVTVLEKHDHILKDEDEDVAAELTSILNREGVEILTTTVIGHVTGKSGDSVTLNVQQTTASGTKDMTLTGSHLLVATGRLPNTENIGLEEAGITLTRSGHVAVDEHLRTSVDGVFAGGDCAGSPHFTHIGSDDVRIILSYLSGNPIPGGTSARKVPSVLFTSPELGHVGLREKEAKAKGVKYRLAKLPMAGVLRVRTFDKTGGLMKMLVEEDSDKILGFTALGPNAGEMLPVVQLAMKNGLAYQDIEEIILVHPTMNEGLASLFSALPQKSAPQAPLEIVQLQ